jgi:hypothetical protein
LGFHRGENGFGLTGVLFRASVYEMFISTVFVPDFFSFDEHLTIFGRGHIGFATIGISVIIFTCEFPTALRTTNDLSFA